MDVQQQQQQQQQQQELDNLISCNYHQPYDVEPIIDSSKDNNNNTNSLNHSNSSSATSTPLPQLYSDVISVHSVMPQSTDNQINIEQNTLANAGHATLLTDSPNPLIHSNVISTADQSQLSSPQLSVPNHASPTNPVGSIVSNEATNELINNNGLVLPHGNMFINSSSPPIHLNQSPFYDQNIQQIQPQVSMQLQEMSSHLPTQQQQQQQQSSFGIIAQPSIEHHPIVPSQRTLEHAHTVPSQAQSTLEEHQERVAAAAQQVMAQQIAQQYAIIQHQQVVNEHILQSQQSAQSVQPQSQPMPIQHQFLMNNDPGQPPSAPSQETPHVVLSQMSMLSPSSPNPSLVNNLVHVNGNTTATTTPVATPTSSLQNAIFHQHIHRTNFVHESNKRPAIGQPTLIERKKSRRHTVSNGQPPVLSIDTKDIPALSSSPRSAVVLVPSQPFTRSEERKAFIDQQKKSLGTIKIPPPPTPQELGMVQSASAVSAKDYEGLTRAQLISRLIELEAEKIQNDNSDNKEKDEEEEASPSDNQESKPDSVTVDEDKSTVDDEEEEEEESVVEEEPKTEKMQCKWRDCGIYLDELQKLITHINTEHVGSGKASYSCEWENCPRKEKPFTKRHKMYNHLRTHTGERPFVCTQDGCGKKFSRPDSLTTHIKTHSNVRPYTCYVKNCGKSYYHARSLRKHEKTHEESPTAMLSTPNSSIQYSGVSPAATSTNSTPFSSNMPGHIQVDYLNSPIQHSPLPVQTPSLPNSPHPPVPQQQQQNFTMLQSQTSSPVNKSYTPPNHMLSFSPAGMVEQQQQQQNNELSINQQQQQLLDSVNQQHNTTFGYGQQQ